MLLHVDRVAFSHKPEKGRIAGIKMRLTEPGRIKDISTEELARLLMDGYTVQPGVTPFSEKSKERECKGTQDEDFTEQTVFMCDIDNAENGEKETPAHIAQILKQHGLKAAFMYETFHSTPDNMRFRFVLVCDEKVTDRRERDKIQAGIIALSRQSDPTCKNADRVFFGGKSLIDGFTDFSATCKKADLLRLADLLPKSSTGSTWKAAAPHCPQPGGSASIPEGERNATLSRLALSHLKRYGMGETAIDAFMLDAARCTPPLDDKELNRIWNSAVKAYGNKVLSNPDYKTPAEYEKYIAQKKARQPAQVTKDNLKDILTPLTDLSEKETEWLVPGWMPRGCIISSSGNGGSGKTFVWVDIAAAVSSGKKPLIAYDIPDEMYMPEPEKVLFISGEDDVERTLLHRLRKAGANMENIATILPSNPKFQDIKFNNSLLGEIIAAYRPALVIFDPIQSFVPQGMNMGYRNDMRQCLTPLIKYGELYQTTFLIIMHTNKKIGIGGRGRAADSSDIWDISRSFMMIGNTHEKGIHYLSHEKSNYGPLQKTLLFSIEDEAAKFMGWSEKRDEDFQNEKRNVRQDAAKNPNPLVQYKDALTGFLEESGGEAEAQACDNFLNDTLGCSGNKIKAIKKELKDEGKIKYKTKGNGRGRGVRHIVQLISHPIGKQISLDDVIEQEEAPKK